jgi:hypothetical protein
MSAARTTRTSVSSMTPAGSPAESTTAKVNTAAEATRLHGDVHCRPLRNRPLHSQARTRESKAMTASTPAPSALVRPFTVAIPDSEIEDLKQRLARTRWPNPETVPDWSQGVRLENAQSLISYWEREYDWRRFESELNRFPQFLTTIDGLDIHFIHARSGNPNAMPLILTHGWPGSIAEFLKLIGPLTDPAAFGGNVEDSFDVVVPSLPGFGFSQKPTDTGWSVTRIAAAWVELMKRHPRALHRRSRRSEPPSGHEARDRRNRPGRLSGWAGGLDLRQVSVQDGQSRPRRGRSQHR